MARFRSSAQHDNDRYRGARAQHGSGPGGPIAPGFTSAFAPAASAGVPTSELDFTYQVDDALTNYGLTNDNIPFFDISLDKVAEIVHESNDPGQKTLARVCSAIEAQHFAAALNGYPYSDTCAGVLMDALQQKQQLQYAENLSSLPLIRVILDPTGYWVQDFEDLGA